MAFCRYLPKMLILLGVGEIDEQHANYGGIYMIPNLQLHATYALWLDTWCDCGNGESNIDELFDSFHNFLCQTRFIYAEGFTKAALLPMFEYSKFNYRYEQTMMVIEGITLKLTPRCDFPEIF